MQRGTILIRGYASTKRLRTPDLVYYLGGREIILRIAKNRIKIVCLE
jgi:hypothetical protein